MPTLQSFNLNLYPKDLSFIIYRIKQNLRVSFGRHLLNSIIYEVRTGRCRKMTPKSFWNFFFILFLSFAQHWNKRWRKLTVFKTDIYCWGTYSDWFSVRYVWRLKNRRCVLGMQTAKIVIIGISTLHQIHEPLCRESTRKLQTLCAWHTRVMWYSNKTSAVLRRGEKKFQT